MGSAVSGAVSAVSGALIPGGGVSGALLGGGNPLSAITGQVGSGIADIVNSVVPAVPIADQSRLNNQTNVSGGFAQTGMSAANAYGAQAANQLGVTQQALGQSQGAINNAQQVNQGQGSNVNSAIGLLGQTAAGGGPAQQAASAQLQRGTDQAIASQHALANSGNLSQQISGQKTAMDNAANLQQQNALNASQLQAGMAAGAQGQYAGAAAQQAGQAAQNAGLSQQQAAQQQGIYGTQVGAQQSEQNIANAAQANAITGETNALGIQQQALGQTAQYRAQALGGLMNAGGAAVGLSDENSKKDVKPVQEDRETRGEGTNGPGYEGPNGEDLRPHYNHEDGTVSTPDPKLKAIKESYVSSDKQGKKDINKKDMISAFLDKIDPVSFKYKEPSGEMGKTPGMHIGVIAQQVEKAPGGKSMVVNTPEGKGIDLAAAVGTLLAAAAQSHQKIEDLEALFKHKKEKK